MTCSLGCKLQKKYFLGLLNYLYNHKFKRHDKLDLIRQQIREEMKNFTLYDNKKPMSSEELNAFIPELNGSSIKSLIISKQRSGSTFLSSILYSLPGSFRIYEPFKLKKNDFSFKYLRKMLNCNFKTTHGKEYVAFKEDDINIIHRKNGRIKSFCDKHPIYCYSPQLATELCRLFPILIVKDVKFPLKRLENILLNEK